MRFASKPIRFSNFSSSSSSVQSTATLHGLINYERTFYGLWNALIVQRKFVKFMTPLAPKLVFLVLVVSIRAFSFRYWGEKLRRVFWRIRHRRELPAGERRPVPVPTTSGKSELSSNQMFYSGWQFLWKRRYNLIRQTHCGPVSAGVLAFKRLFCMNGRQNKITRCCIKNATRSKSIFYDLVLNLLTDLILNRPLKWPGSQILVFFRHISKLFTHR